MVLSTVDGQAIIQCFNAENAGNAKSPANLLATIELSDDGPTRQGQLDLLPDYARR